VRLIDGRAIAASINADTAAAALDTPAALHILVPTADEASAWYVRSIRRAAEKLGIGCAVEELSDPDRATIEARLDALSADPAVSAILCQTPLPPGVRLADVGLRIDPAKDVDGANPASLGRLAGGLPAYAPATAAAVVEVLKRDGVDLTGRRVVVIGRSLVVGKPVALLLLAENATVTVCHSRSTDLPGICREADVLVAAVGRPGLVDASYVKPGAVVVDVGTNPTAAGGITGDVDAAAVEAVAGALTPVPGGIGPVTTALLLRQTVQAAAGPPQASGRVGASVG
jgi:methylenetetrahydrofolate dehydrogenase (NADP+) / methenyltetrahydrofolate cyclohydrolase